MNTGLDPRGPAALMAAATGTFPHWATGETARAWNGRIAFDYLTRFAGHDVLRELSALSEIGWRVQIKCAPGRQLRITLYKADR